MDSLGSLPENFLQGFRKGLTGDSSIAIWTWWRLSSKPVYMATEGIQLFAACWDWWLSYPVKAIACQLGLPPKCVEKESKRVSARQGILLQLGASGLFVTFTVANPLETSHNFCLAHKRETWNKGVGCRKWRSLSIHFRRLHVIHEICMETMYLAVATNFLLPGSCMSMESLAAWLLPWP